MFDVSVEGIGLVGVDRYEQRASEPAPEQIEFEKHPDEISHAQAQELEGADPFVGCERRCVGINWYCIENPRCFEEK